MNPIVESLPLSFMLLGAAIVSTWFRLPSISNRVPLWALFYVAAIVLALIDGYLRPIGVIGLALLAVSVYFTAHGTSPESRFFAGTSTVVTALLLAFHVVPGFANPILINQLRITPDALPYTMYANFDKASAGLLFLALICKRAHTSQDWRTVLLQSAQWLVPTIAATFAVGYALGYVKVAPKIPHFTLLFVVVNLLFVCVAEETFFRGFIQERIASYLKTKGITAASTIALVVGAVLFGLSHIGGGMTYVLLATIAGMGYGYSYLKSGSIEAPIITHFVLNFVHFIGFTYPAIAHS
jgi:uncharacterized protein